MSAEITGPTLADCMARVPARLIPPGGHPFTPGPCGLERAQQEAGRPGPDGGTIYFGPFSGVNAAVELRAWRLFGADVMPFLCEALAAQGEAPDAKLLSLQHALAELLASSAHPQPQVNTPS